MITKEDLEDKCECIGFRLPKTLIEMKAWDYFHKIERIPVGITEIYTTMGITPKKVHQYLNKIEKGLTRKEEIEYMTYVAGHTLEIRCLLAMFRV
jgi:predicted adenine nucleotide alpha hydrolase (AANH) superfamily ATPase